MDQNERQNEVRVGQWLWPMITNVRGVAPTRPAESTLRAASFTAAAVEALKRTSHRR